MTLFDDPTPWPDKLPSDAQEAAQYVADWLADNLPAAVFKRLPAAVTAAQPTKGISDLRLLLEWWNGLFMADLVAHGVNAKRPSKEMLAAWEKFQQNATAQECLSDLDAVKSELEKSSFCRQGWFRLEKLLRGACNASGIPIVRVLMDGGYRDAKNANNAAKDPFAEFAARHAN